MDVARKRDIGGGSNLPIGSDEKVVDGRVEGGGHVGERVWRDGWREMEVVVEVLLLLLLLQLQGRGVNELPARCPNTVILPLVLLLGRSCCWGGPDAAPPV